MKEGLFIVIYGANNLGKSVQAERLVESFIKAGLKAELIKYPIYDLKPTGPKINEILRSKSRQSISEEEFQKLYAQNRRDYQPQLCKRICDGINIVAECYVGTGLAWGWTKGADLEKLIEINKGLLVPDIAILLDGERFTKGKEEIHQHEANEQWWEQCRLNFMKLATRFGWEVVEANQSVEAVHEDILKIIKEKVKLIDH